MNLNTIVSRFFGRDEAETSKEVAKERLRLVLVHDRLDVSEHVMNSLREDLLNVIGKYFGIDERTLEVSFSREADGMALVANIPIRRHPPSPVDTTGPQPTSTDTAGQQTTPDNYMPADPDASAIPPKQDAAASKQRGSKQGTGKKSSKPKQPRPSKNDQEQAVEAHIN